MPRLFPPQNHILITHIALMVALHCWLALDDDLAAVEGLTGTGGVARTGDNTWTTYPLTEAGKALLAGTDATAQRSTLGLGSLATASSVSGTTIDDGTITNADISDSAAIADTKLSTITAAGKVANSATTATSDITPGAIVARDASGNFSAGTITATLNGNATNVTGVVSLLNGGTGATTAPQARTNLGAAASGATRLSRVSRPLPLLAMSESAPTLLPIVSMWPHRVWACAQLRGCKTPSQPPTTPAPRPCMLPIAPPTGLRMWRRWGD